MAVGGLGWRWGTGSSEQSPLPESRSPSTAFPCALPRVSTEGGISLSCRSRTPPQPLAPTRPRWGARVQGTHPSPGFGSALLAQTTRFPFPYDSGIPAGCTAPRCHPGLEGCVSTEAERSAAMDGLAGSGEAGVARTPAPCVLRHLLPKPLLARAVSTGLATVQRLFKIPTQPPEAQILSPGDKLIDSSSDLIIFARTFLFLGVRRGVSCYSFLFAL